MIWGYCTSRQTTTAGLIGRKFDKGRSCERQTRKTGKNPITCIDCALCYQAPLRKKKEKHLEMWKWWSQRGPPPKPPPPAQSSAGGATTSKCGNGGQTEPPPPPTPPSQINLRGAMNTTSRRRHKTAILIKAKWNMDPLSSCGSSH